VSFADFGADEKMWLRKGGKCQQGGQAGRALIKGKMPDRSCPDGATNRSAHDKHIRTTPKLHEDILLSPPCQEKKRSRKTVLWPGKGKQAYDPEGVFYRLKQHNKYRRRINMNQNLGEGEVGTAGTKWAGRESWSGGREKRGRHDKAR